MKFKGFRLGATGKFPQGRADQHDEGELRMAIVADHQQAIVRLVFGTPIAWLGLSARDARQLATMLNEKADELESRKH